MNKYFEKGTFNTVSYGNTGEFGGSFPVWARIENRLVGGGYFDLNKTNPLTGATFKAGDIIPAGTMVHYAGSGKELTIIPNAENDAEVSAGKCNGLVDNDVLIPANCLLATAAVVVKGRIYADRVCNGEGGSGAAKTWGLPSAVESMLPMIEFVREA